MKMRTRGAGWTAAFVLGASLAAPAAPAKKGAAGGYAWSVPARWTEQAARSMRVATYTVPAAAGAEAGECAVFFFATGEGGSIDANVERWSRQFEGTPKPERSARTVRGVPVTTVRLSGAYLAPGGPMMQSQGKRPGYLLVGAIAETAQGNLFYKLTGPAATVTAAQAEWEALIASLAAATGPAAAPPAPIK
jgi:hypothetical protein